MSSFIALDNNCYLTFVAQRARPWRKTIEDFFFKLPIANLNPVINQRSHDYVIGFVLGVENLLSDPFTRKLLQKRLKGKSGGENVKLESFIHSVDSIQFNEIIGACARFLKSGKDIHLLLQSSELVRRLIDRGDIALVKAGRKKNPVSTKLFASDSEDAILLEELFAIKAAKFNDGDLYSEDADLIAFAKQENAPQALDIRIQHARSLEQFKKRLT